MFVVRKYEERDVPACAKCFYESFFDCPLTEKDKIFLRDYAYYRALQKEFRQIACQNARRKTALQGVVKVLFQVRLRGL